MTEETNRFGEMLHSGDFSGLFRAVLESREAADRGEYCECPEPLGDGLSCARCMRRSKVRELAAVHRLVDAHAYEPGRIAMCARCTCFEDAPRHHGEPAVGRTSWGEAVQGVREDGD
jgi:hypothetical protein